jgi:ankyrin repeat protein
MERMSHGAASVDTLRERFTNSKPAILTYGRLYEESAEGVDVSDTHLSEYELAQPLYYMTLAGMLRQTRKMIQKGADVNDTGGEFGTALQAASYKGHDEIARYLIASGANVNQRAGYFCSPFRAAVFGDHASIVLILIESSANVDAEMKNFTKIRSSKANNPLDNPDLGYLHRSLYAMRQDELNIFYPRGKFFSALQLASSNGLTDMVRLFLDRGADISATDCTMRTALHCATSQLDIDGVSCLLRKGALVDGPESAATPLQELIEPIHHYWTHTTERFDLVAPLINLLVRSGADLSRVSCYDALCLHYREGEHHHHPFLSLTYSLIEQGINIRKRKECL